MDQVGPNETRRTCDKAFHVVFAIKADSARPRGSKPCRIAQESLKKENPKYERVLAVLSLAIRSLLQAAAQGGKYDRPLDLGTFLAKDH
jgi:hypothetical protein